MASKQTFNKILPYNYTVVQSGEKMEAAYLTLLYNKMFIMKPLHCIFLLFYFICFISDNTGWTAVHSAAVTDDQDILTLILHHKRCRHLLNKQDHAGTTPLMAALKTKSYKTLELLCIKGADVSLANLKSGETLLHVASHLKDVKAAQILLKFKSSPEFINRMNALGNIDTFLLYFILYYSTVTNLLFSFDLIYFRPLPPFIHSTRHNAVYR